MAVDATGTPTSPDSIPTYNTAVDAPSGKGLNNIVAALQTALSARIPKTLVTTTGDIIYASGASTPARLGIGSAGQALVVSGGVPAWGSSGGPGAPATTLPGSPTDGQQAILTDSTTTPTYAWLFQWSSTASKWYCIGGSPYVQMVSTAETTSSTSYADLSTVGPSLTAPRAGVYVITAGCDGANSSSTNDIYLGVKIGAGGATDLIRVAGNVTANVRGGAAAWNRYTAAASDVMKIQYKVASSGTGTFEFRSMSVMPVYLT